MQHSGTALLIGATSDIGRAIARRLAAAGYALQLAARVPAQLQADRCDLRLRSGVGVTLHRCDVLQPDAGLSLLAELPTLPDVAVCLVGLLGDQQEAERDAAAAELVMRTNYLGPALLMGALAERFQQRGSGVLVGVSSVAGDRGRAANYLYGSAKAGFSAFLSGLRGRLAASGVHVVTVKPGFVRTRMTDGRELPERLTAHPDAVAAATLDAIRRRRHVIYVRPVWRLIMLLLRALPEPLFMRLTR